VAGCVHGRSVHPQDDGRIAARAHLGRGRRGSRRTRLTRTSRGTPPPSPHPSPAPGRARESWWAYSHPDHFGRSATQAQTGPSFSAGPRIPRQLPRVWCGDEASHRALFDAVSEVAPKSLATEVVSASA
jgi:hypothetical protein